MSIQGNLNTMKLPDLLRWAAEQSATGVLEVERNKVCKRIAFREGRITKCSSDDPPSRIGQFLLARGKISREELAQALRVQTETQVALGAILQDMGVLEAEELAYELGAKAEENLFSLFDWTEAVFRFKTDEPEDPWMLDVRMSVEEIIERGTQRSEQLEAIRRLFVGSGVVLEHGDVRVPPEVTANGLARGIMATIDGERTIGEVLYHAHASEFLVLKFLVSAVHAGFVKIAGVRETNDQQSTLLDAPRAEPAPPQPVTAGPAAEPAPIEPRQAEPAGDEAVAAAQPQPEPPRAAVEEPQDESAVEVATSDERNEAPEMPAPPAAAPESTFEEQLELAQHFLAQDEVEAALDVLDDCYDARPGEEFLGHLIQKAETAFLKHCREGAFKSSCVPSKVIAQIDLSQSPLSPAELYLLGMTTEGHAIQTLLWIAPMREIDVYRGLARLLKAGVIELRDGGDVDLEGEKAPAIEWA